MDPSPGFMLFGTFISPGPIQLPEPPQLLQPNPSPASFPAFNFVEKPDKPNPIPNPCSSPASSVTNRINQNPISQHPVLEKEDQSILVVEKKKIKRIVYKLNGKRLPSSPASSVTNPINENPNSQHPVVEKEDQSLVVVEKKNPLIKRLSPERELLSPQLRRLLVSMGVAEEHNPTHFFTRSLFPSDVKKGLNRLTIPRNHLLAPFLTHQEEAFLQQRDHNNNLKRLQVDVVDPSLTVRVLSLSRWSYKKPDRGGKGGPPSWSYALNGGWMDVVNCNGLSAGDSVQVWSFRKMDASLGFIIFKEEKQSAVVLHNGSSSSDDNGNKEKGSTPTWGKKRKRGSRSSLSTMTTA